MRDARIKENNIVMGKQQRIVLFESHVKSILKSEREDNLPEINALLADGWRVVSMSPTSSPATSAGAEYRIFALVVMEKDV
jgi:hypothetical protein